ncbi:MAG TPA: sulfatase-like hydrolase/transferase [Pirellulales bacterium]|nr:sulfatase-like hydrolase/transferase [Pirellulales bacterium]
MGAYGNTWTSTPALDQLAADSFVLDRAIIDSPQLDVIYRSLWLGLHALCPNNRESQREHLATLLSRAGWQTALLADAKEVTELPSAAAFAERMLMHSITGKIGSASIGSCNFHSDTNKILISDNHKVAVSVEETDAAAIFAAAGNWLEAARQEPFFLWIHTGTLGRVWDAPLEFRQMFADEDDPPLGNWANVPNRVLPPRFDPDELLAATHAYAGQVSLIDQFIGSLLEVIENTGHAGNTIFICFSLRGFPLGEHDRVGPCDESLYSELTHVPWFIRIPVGTGSPGHLPQLVQPADLPATILDYCGLNHSLPMDNRVLSSGAATEIGFGRSLLPLSGGKHLATFDRACVVAPPNQRVFITPFWSLRLSNCVGADPEHASEEDATAQLSHRSELFVKPDDWLEVNEVSDRCPEIKEKMEAAMTQFTLACQSGSPAMLAKLPDEITADF